MKNTIKALSLTSFLLLPALASAEIYVGGAVGKASSDVSSEDFTPIELFGGFQFNENFSIEAGYIDFGDVKEDVLGTSVKTSLDGYNIALKASLPVAEQISLYGKLGYFMWDSKASSTVDGQTVSASGEGEDVNYGVGLAWAVHEQVDVNFGYQIFDFEGDDIKNLSVGVSYRF